MQTQEFSLREAGVESQVNGQVVIRRLSGGQEHFIRGQGRGGSELWRGYAVGEVAVQLFPGDCKLQFPVRPGVVVLDRLDRKASQDLGGVVPLDVLAGEPGQQGMADRRL